MSGASESGSEDRAYRIYNLSADGQIIGAQNREFDCDAEALSHALSLLHEDFAVEVWQTRRLVCKLERAALFSAEAASPPSPAAASELDADDRPDRLAEIEQAMQRFVHGRSLERYIDLLEVEVDPSKRAVLRQLLIEEEDRFGSNSERLDRAEQAIFQGEARIAKQRALVARLHGGGLAMAVGVLANMNDTLRLMAHYRQTLLDELDGKRL